MIPRFKKSRFEPKPIETDYWIDLNENEYGGVFKYYDNNAMVWKQTESITKEKEPLFTNSPASKITTDDIDYWNSKVGIEDFDALKDEVLDLGSKYEGVTIETLEYYLDQFKNESSWIDGDTLQSALETKADKANTLKGYGISNAYTKTEVDKKFNEWKVELPENVSYFKNDAGYVTEENLESKLPENIVSDANYVHTDNNFNNEYKSKLDKLTDDLKAIEYDDTEVKRLINENTKRISSLQSSVENDISTIEENIAIAAEAMSEEIAKKANADEVYTRTYLDEVFTQFVRKTHKTYGFIDERPTRDLTVNDTGFIFYDYTVNEALLWVADEWRLLRTNQALTNFINDEDIVRQVIDWEWEQPEDSEFCTLYRYLGEYTETIDLEVPNIYIDAFVMQLGRTSEYWQGKTNLKEHPVRYGNSIKAPDGTTIFVGRPFNTETKIFRKVYQPENRNPGYYIPGTDDDPNDDVYPEDVQVNYITNIFGNKVMSPRETTSTHYTTLFQHDNTVTNVNSITLPQGIKTIGMGAFYGISAATNNDLQIPSGVEYIDDFAFYNSSVETLKFPRNPIRLGIGAFYKSNLKEIHFPKTLDWDFIKEGGSEQCFRELPNTLTLVLDEGVKAIPNYAFYGTKITDLQLPDSLEYIGEYAFYGSLTDAKFDSNKLQYIGPNSFVNSTFTSVHFRENVTKLPPAIFGDTKQSKLTQLILPPNLEKSYIYSFPYNMSKIAMAFTTPPSLKELPQYMFYYYGGSVNKPTFDENNLPVFPLPDVKVHLSEGLESIGTATFYQSCFSGELVLPESLKYIASSGLGRCTGFNNRKLRIPKNVKIIGGTYQLFGSQPSYSEAIDEETYNKYIPLSKSGYGTIQFWDYLEDGGELSENSFETFYLFACNSMKEFEVDPENKWFTAVDGVLFSKDLKRLVGYPCAYGQTRYEIPEGCVYMDCRVFAGTGYKKKFTITKPDGTEQTITCSWGTMPQDSYVGEGQLREIVIPNTMINYTCFQQRI